MRFTTTARDLLSGDEEKQFEAAEKYTQLTDYVTDQILRSNHLSLREVIYIYIYT